MALPGPYSGVSTLAFVARVSALTLGFVYGGVKLSYLQRMYFDNSMVSMKWLSKFDLSFFCEFGLCGLYCGDCVQG
ncbi:hypothetical protein M5K25_026197 [Dendrobium thyrsiflorum]|uniref:Uncharacterized protein n=1 Tax=Dendrobium thyrsiflorum TaxID=117978 RepID=A0ABD0TWU2_DENTH